MMEIVASSDLIRPKPTYDPRIITSRFSPRRESPSLERLSPYSQYSRPSSPSKYSTSPPHSITTLSQSSIKLPTVSIPFVTSHGLVYAKHSPKGLVLSSDPSNSTSPNGESPATTPTTPLPTPPGSQNFNHLQQPTPTRLAPKKIYTCKLCGKTFNNSGNFSRHQKVHTGEKPYRCEICGKAFTQSSTLKRHILSHSGDRSYKCQVCSKGYVDPWSLKKHMKNHGFNTYSHVQVKPILPHYKFHPPNVVVPPKGHMQHHWMKPEITPPGLYLPLSSEQPSPTMPTFKSGGSAFTTVESKVIKPGFVPATGYNPSPTSAPKSAEGEEPAKNEDGSTPAPEGEEKPDALILYIDTLKQSIKTYQDNKPESDTKENGGDNIMQFTPTRQLSEKESEMYMCDKCGRSFNNLDNFKTHQVIHAGSLACNGELACHQCKAVFLTKQQLQAHMTTHTSSYWCVYCERSFRNEYNFKQHQTVHTTLSHEGDKKYPGWLENFRQEMMTCVTSLDTPMPVPPVNTPSSGHSHPSCPTPSTAGPSRDENEEVDVESSEPNKNESPKNKIRKVTPASPSPTKRALNKLAEIKELKMKAMMDIDPLGHAMIPKFCHPSASSHYYSASSAGSAYSAVSSLRSAGSGSSRLSGASSISMDPLSDYPHDMMTRPHSAGILPPPSSAALPIHPMSINGIARPMPHSAGGHSVDPSFKLDRSIYMEDRMRAIKSSYIDESSYIPRSLSTEHRRSVESWSTEMPRIPSQEEQQPSPVKSEEASPSKEDDLSARSPQAELEQKEELKIEELESGNVGEERSTKRPKISYQCCMCAFNSTKLSDLTLHLEKTHSLGDYELIKMLLACLGDIGA